MTKYRDILEARKTLNLPERASMQQIKSNYRKLMSQWHPDKCKENGDECQEMSRRITAAYEVIVVYCEHYEYSFAKEEVKRYISPEDWWSEKFGTDPLWGNIKKKP